MFRHAAAVPWITICTIGRAETDLLDHANRGVCGAVIPGMARDEQRRDAFPSQVCDGGRRDAFPSQVCDGGMAKDHQQICGSAGAL